MQDTLIIYEWILVIEVETIFETEYFFNLFLEVLENRTYWNK